MIIKTHNETKTTVLRTTWKFKDDEQEYLASWSVCDNPFCGCSEMTFGIGTELKTRPMASFTFDVITKQVKAIGFDSSSKLLSERLVSELTPEDNKILVSIFRSEKLKCEEKCNIHEIDPPVFPAKKIENESIMIDFKQIFPWSKEHWFTVNNNTYFVIDQYCLNSACNCQSVILDFLGFHNDVHLNEKDPTIVTYNCGSGKWEASEVGKETHPPPTLMKEMFAKYPDFRRTLNERRTQLRLLYKRYREKTGMKTTPTNSISYPQVAGRNDPCPCGSGKKFKKCCGKQS